MKRNRSILATVSGILWLGLTNSCSQPASPVAQSSFEATTPCNESVRKMLNIPAGIPCEMMKWHLALFRDSQKPAAETFTLVCEFGMPKQGTKGFEEGSKKIELKGRCSVEKGIPKNANGVVYVLHADVSGISLSFLQPDQNLLHLLNEDKSLVNGTGAWSYTLNRIDPVHSQPAKFIPGEVAATLTITNSDTVGVFDGRTPCDNHFRALKDIPAAGCQIVKCRLILLRDKNTLGPGNFLLYTIYVGNGDNNRHITSGKWKLMKATANNASAVIYRLEPDATASNQPILLLKADDNILFFIDSNGRMMVGNSYASYTLNRK